MNRVVCFRLRRRASRVDFLQAALMLFIAAGLSGCAGWFTPPPGIGREVAWSRLPGWEQDRHAAAWPALRKSCEKLSVRDATWENLCLAARALESPDDAAARAFFEANFRAHRMHADNGRDGLITGYYEPVLIGSTTRSDRFRWPLYKRPDNLLIVDLASLYPELKGRPVRGRLEGNRVVPYYSRAEIGMAKNPLAGHELLWVEDPVELFILQVQGSGRVRLPDGSEIAVGYADQNGHPYRSLGGRLIERGELTREEVTLTRIRDWLAAHPEETGALLNSNPSYIFFTQRDAQGRASAAGDRTSGAADAQGRASVPHKDVPMPRAQDAQERPAGDRTSGAADAALDGPLGTLGVALTPGRSIAVDPAYIPLGVPVWLDGVLPDGAPLKRLTLAQDTGGAIKGAVRADLFIGRGVEAGRLAGEMKQRGRMYVLMPKLPEAARAPALR